MSFAITTGDLVAVTIVENDNYKELITLPDEQKSYFFRAEDCARTLYITHAENQQHFPQSWHENRLVRVFTGKDAYEEILTIVSGLGSRQKGESHSLFNFRNKLRELRSSETGKSLYKRLERVSNNILEDAKFLQSRALDNSPKVNFLRAARCLSMRHPNERVLILGDVDELVKAMAYTVGLTTTKKKQGDIVVTKNSQRELVERLGEEEKYFGAVRETPLGNLMDNRFAGISHIFIMSPLVQECREKFLEAWKERASPETDVCIVPSSNMVEMQCFEKIFEFEGSHCFNSRDIVGYLETEKKKRKAKVEWAQEGVKKLSYSRFRDERPLFKELDKTREAYERVVEKVKTEREEARLFAVLPG